ncbi:MAG: hypothetical protein J7500_02630 [Sphingomonas sp.]|uniref:hypothetical protein n=1 Tax=Sphingomonas sp. TaxID=28214 RepID=UPI001B11F05D|nr:hypothetical protein [Sphingomonas sp.]MBO9621586.1 hypothetical protein [Sphingomonas sp.]
MAPTPTSTPWPQPSTPAPRPYVFSFQVIREWSWGYGEYSIGQEEAIGFAGSHERLPAPLEYLKGVRLRSDNRSGEVFMYIFRRLDGFKRSTWYRAYFTIRVATNAPIGCGSLEGAPGESVTLKAGATTGQPIMRVRDRRVISDFDKGNHASSGAESVVLGNIAGTQIDCAGPRSYEIKTLGSASGVPVQTDAEGRLWLYIGTDSAFFGVTDIYILEGSIEFAPQ